VQQRASNFGGNQRELKRRFTDPTEDMIDGAYEPQTQPGLLLVIPRRGSLDVGLRQRPYNPLAVHRRCLALAQLVAEAFADDVPARACARIRVVILQTFLEDVAVPFGDRNLLWCRSDPVPQGLHVRDLIIDREVIKSGGRQWDRLGHVRGPTIDYSVPVSVTVLRARTAHHNRNSARHRTPRVVVERAFALRRECNGA
jgi:hypothetical protein